MTDLYYSYAAFDNTEVRALDNINISITKGEYIAVIGTNGSGKSTLAKHFNALLLPMRGQCLIYGLDPAIDSNIWPIRQKIGMVFQNPDNQIVAAIVEEDVAFGPENLGVDPGEIKERVNDALDLVGMKDYQYHAPHLLSGGQKQRIAIAGVLAMKPECLVLDEATAMLDPLGRREVLEIIAKLNKEKKLTVINITHFMEEAVQAKRVIVLDNGEIVLQGSPKEVFSQRDLLKKIGLDVPLAVELSRQLEAAGLDIDSGIITEEELLVALCR